MQHQNRIYIQPYTFDLTKLCVALYCVGEATKMCKAVDAVKAFMEEMKRIDGHDKETMELLFIKLCNDICNYGVMGYAEAKKDKGKPYEYFALGVFQRERLLICEDDMLELMFLYAPDVMSIEFQIDENEKMELIKELSEKWKVIPGTMDCGVSC